MGIEIFEGFSTLSPQSNFATAGRDGALRVAILDADRLKIAITRDQRRETQFQNIHLQQEPGGEAASPAWCCLSHLSTANERCRDSTVGSGETAYRTVRMELNMS